MINSQRRANLHFSYDKRSLMKIFALKIFKFFSLILLGEFLFYIFSTHNFSLSSLRSEMCKHEIYMKYVQCSLPFWLHKMKQKYYSPCMWVGRSTKESEKKPTLKLLRKNVKIEQESHGRVHERELCVMPPALCLEI